MADACSIITPSTLITPAITSIAAFASVWLSNRLSLTRSYNEKAWEIRRQVYGEIIFELSQALIKCGWVDEACQMHGSGYFERSEPTLNKIFEHCSSATTAFRTNYIMLSDEFVSCYESYQKAKTSDEYDPDPIEAYEVLSKALKIHVPDLTKQARREVIVRRWSWLRGR